ncbi:MAG: Lrp/AsnC family transcriptional regulator [Candidatus Adiutrix sp.]|jgi:DNA-binding Lrp family transcriptional regulator|nr:Lrp/AsnC family transcriptional regulator [Candidatus Adiutrix sp.]
MGKVKLERLDRLILNAIQKDFPVAGRPYAVLARKLNREYDLNLDEAELLNRVRALRRNGFIRRLGAVFSPALLGYRSALCAARVPEDRLALFTELVNRAPEVTHNYLREGDFNVWFTFTSNRQDSLGLFLENIRRESGVAEIHVLESEKLFKIKVDFKFSEPARSGGPEL